MIYLAYRKDNMRDGLSLVELAFVMLVIGVVLGVLWQRVADIRENMEASRAMQEMNALLQAVRLAHPNDIVGENEDFEVPGITPDMIGSFRGNRILYNPWRGGVDIFPGNAMGWGKDSYNQEFTISYSGLTPKACEDLVKLSMNNLQPNNNLVMMYFSPFIGQGKPICVGADSYCVNPVASVPPSLIPPMCAQHNPMTVMFTFQAH